MKESGRYIPLGFVYATAESVFAFPNAGAAAAHAISLSGDGSIDDDRDMADWQVSGILIECQRCITVLH